MGIKSESFGMMPSGETAILFTIENGKGLKAGITNFGGTLVSLSTPDKNNLYDDIVLGYDCLADYLKCSWFLGSTIGRCSGRIKDGVFRINGKTYYLNCNFGDNHIHGGPIGYGKILWNYNIPDNKGNTLLLNHYSRDGEENYPGNLNVTVTYTLGDDNRLTITYDASTDQDTIVSLTNHSYFNLAGHNSGNILGHRLTVLADSFTSVFSDGLPTGDIVPVNGTSLDFTTPRYIGDAIKSGIENGEKQICMFNGIDQNYVLNLVDDKHGNAVELYDEESGRCMDIYTTMPGMQLFTSNNWPGLNGKNGAVYKSWAGVAFEPQFFPDSINHDNFPSPILYADKKYHHITEYRFYVK